MNPQAAADLGLHEGDYVYVDANELDRPYIGWKDDAGARGTRRSAAWSA